MSLALVYLARGGTGGLTSAKEFFEAYRTYPPGCPHELVVIAKGWSESAERDGLEQLSLECAAKIVDLPDDGFDWGAYMRIAGQLTHTWVCFLNTHSRPLVTGWLGMMLEHAQTTGVGAVGATASWGTMLPIWPLVKPEWEWRLLMYPARLVRDLFIISINFRYFPLFPNPHLRSNAFLVRRELFCEFTRIRNIPRHKRDSHILESGKTGLTRFLTNLGLKPLVVGADGNSYGQDEWIDSGTFRVPGQPNLLVADNQTIYYSKANRSLKKRLELAAWGRSITGAKSNDHIN